MIGVGGWALEQRILLIAKHEDFPNKFNFDVNTTCSKYLKSKKMVYYCTLSSYKILEKTFCVRQ